MSETDIFYGLVFLATVLLVISFHSYFVAPYAANKKVNRRLILLQAGTNGAATLASLRRECWLTDDRYSENVSAVRRFIVQSGVRLDVRQLSLTVLILAAGFGAFFWYMYGPTLYTLLRTIGSTGVALIVYFQRERSKRIAKFKEQLPDVLDLLVRSLRAGHPLPVAFSLAAREMPDPVGTELGLVADEVQFGSTIPVAVTNMSYRVGDPDLDYLVTCISIQGQTGGNLGEVLGRLARLMRERFRLSRKVRALTSEARFSAIALSLFPVILFLLVNLLSPNYYGEVWSDPSFHRTLMSSAGLLLVGNLVMRQLANIKY